FCAAVLFVILVLLANYGRYGRISKASAINDGPAAAPQVFVGNGFASRTNCSADAMPRASTSPLR
ncbi:hypothetical protein, partial [Paraburkholderia sediminicola]|uniref:hypothetical protein n=1 Tax=Paraburkholderia sediminicola TaxID=458836 RepID=UPI0038BA3D1F